MIRIVNVSKQFRHAGKSLPVLKNIHLHIKSGEIFGVIGRSGAGKSTLVRCMNFLEKPSSGEVYVDDVNLATLDHDALRETRHQMGMIFQHFNLLSMRTVFDNVALALELQGAPNDYIKKKVEELLVLVELMDKAHHYPSELSGGQKQRVAIARALATEPKVLLSDEGTSSLDPETTQSILSLLKKINRELGLTIVMITHEMDVVKKICHRLAVMEAGEVVEEGTVMDIFAEPKSPVTQRLTQSALRLDLPAEIENKMHREKSAEAFYPIVRLAFIGKQANEPHLANLLKNFSVEASILQADLEFIAESLIGVSICQLNGAEENIVAALHYLSDCGIKVEVMGYV